MNGRIIEEPTPEGRLAAAVVSLYRETRAKNQNRHYSYRDPDYADVRDSLKPFIERELVIARIQEIKDKRGAAIDFSHIRERELEQELARLNAIVDLIVRRKASP